MASADEPAVKEQALQDGGVTSTGVANATAMDPLVWGNLPEDLLDRVIACLSLHNLFRVRSTCKRCNKVIFSREFVRLVAEVTAQRPWLVIGATDRLSSAYDPSSRTWHDMAINKVCPENCVLATRKGLLCYGSEFFPWPQPLEFFVGLKIVPPVRYARLVYQEPDAAAN